ncbi:M28 family peptidase [Hyunsoonleella pacifica]|uniref:M28 family peptidase n=1 Tax=Hyunsoonleella pacifica TaxID=1080224 RepID=A0A4Q9FMA7_9FLAO|nr:M28 family peptidase [Hyunsoonleella pacifica]TBN15347.1 M28 family peptidase [Hyunsoonleella pacifica]GGD23270.1 peptidase M28 [Hyunsoonleella pacifica]
MKFIITLSLLTLVGTCATPKYTARIENLKSSIKIIDSSLVTKYSKTITSEELKEHLYKFASKEFEGRMTGEPGHKLAAEFVKSYYINLGIPSPFVSDNYYQGIPESYFPKDIKASENVLAYIEGSEKPEEILVLSAHLDHEGIQKGKIYYGADDNGSGTVALLEIAEAFKMAAKNGYRPKRSILFAHFTAEEIGKYGSEFYTENPVFPLENTITNLNIDMIGRVDDRHSEEDDNYIYLIGSDRLSKELHYTSEAVQKAYVDINLDYKFNAINDHNNYYTRSDQYNFAKKGIPVIFYFSGVHEDYSEPTDTPDKINYELLAKRTKLIFATTWQLVNQDKRVAIDENSIFLN